MPPKEEEREEREGEREGREEEEERRERVENGLWVGNEVEGVFGKQNRIEERMRFYHTPAVSLAVVDDHRVVWAKAYSCNCNYNCNYNSNYYKHTGSETNDNDDNDDDNVDEETLFQVASISKPVFALAVMKMKEMGVLDIDRDVNDYLIGWKVPSININDGKWQPKVTLRSLLSHTAGLTVHGFPGYHLYETIPSSLTDVLDGKYPSNTTRVIVNNFPGLTYSYSGGGTTIAQLTVMNALNGISNHTHSSSGSTMSFAKMMKNVLFEPLGLKLSSFEMNPSIGKCAVGYPYKAIPIIGKHHTYPESAAAGLWTNPTELAKLMIEVQLALKSQSTFFKRETIEEMLSPQGLSGNMGIGFYLEGDNNNNNNNNNGGDERFSHGGWNEGFVSKVIMYKNIGKGAVVMINSNEGSKLIDEILRSIAVEYNWPGYLPSERETEEELHNRHNIYMNDKKIVNQFIGDFVYNVNNGGKNNKKKKVHMKIYVGKDNDKDLFLSLDDQPPLKIYISNGNIKFDDKNNNLCVLKSNEMNFSISKINNSNDDNRNINNNDLIFQQHNSSIYFKRKRTNYQKQLTWLMTAGFE